MSEEKKPEGNYGKIAIEMNEDGKFEICIEGKPLELAAMICGAMDKVPELEHVLRMALIGFIAGKTAVSTENVA